MTIRDLVASTEFALDPFPYYEEWRKAGSVMRMDDEDVWIISGYDEALSALKNTRVFSSRPGLEVSPVLHGADGEAHARVRRLLQPLFAPAIQYGQRDRIREIVAEQFKRIEKRSTFDAALDFADPIALRVASEWLGVREAHAQRIRTIEVIDVTPADIENALIPGGMIAGLLESGELAHAEVAELTGFLLLAGVKTAKQLALFGLIEIARHDFRNVSDDLAALTRELLRLQPPAHVLVRSTTEAVRIGGQDIPDGATIWISLASANRDPSRFDRPNDIIGDRDGPRHLSFAAGPHVCLGSHIGLVEAEEMLAVLLPRSRELLRRAGEPAISFSGPGGAPAVREISSWPMSFDA
jgi:cytochrome P450